MGWGRTLFLGDVGNRLDIADAEQDIASLRLQLRESVRTDASQDQKLDMLAEENAELKLYLAAVVRLMVTKGVVSADELEKMVSMIDAEDGRLDGKHGGSLA
jgi:hypothetical protein